MIRTFFTFLILSTFFLTACGEGESDNSDRKESGFNRMISNNTIRCGYYVFPPVTYRDEETDELSGLSVDMMDAIAERAGLEIEWTEEVNFGNWAPALQSGRFDAVCTPMWPEIAMGRAVQFSEPMFYAGLSPMVRVEDERFKGNDIARLNQSDVTFLAQEGNAIDTLTRSVFPKAKVKIMPAMMDGPTVLQEIVTKKADAILLDRNAEIEYNKNNPVKLKLIAPDKPIKVQPFTLVVKRSDSELLDFLNLGMRELHNDGSIERMLEKWEPEPQTFLRVTKPYEVKK